ncbi:DUF4344 domain-containing metallopeptidase [Methylobacterium oxalidis]|uniref:Metallopeptidase n=1 Tax=Methylobacterium oxalidis TaxID=944322 RepID=A0A512IZ57_9HYPH|nr:DUF4344 domain-containing metallopeptidase [Methylobacterium oxalidis]GEP02899.1 hypothetical protein MOX02_09370 [Methylobacterium oxalidis]GJE30312.1 hypothetical protein LDDCCGHA_0479 [Methylobacterium oxalidis]GLS65832.1 hypothetical protein GCM10007888_42140 [Methylobacterium oxalidis]
MRVRGRLSGLFGLALLIGAAPPPGPAEAAQTARHVDAGRIRVVYEAPKKAAYRAIYEDMRRQRVLERIGAIVGLARLPTRLTYRLKECAGELNAWYAPESRSVTLCYELVESVRKAAPKTTSPAGVTRQEALRGPVAQILMHESGHALFDLLDIPILGREEDAADQVAAYALLQLGGREARTVVNGSAYFFATNGKDETVDQGAFADVHGLFWQRFYNLACLAYGSNKSAFGYIVAKGYLPKERAEGCSEEYEQVAFAFERLIVPHLRVKPGPGKRLQHAFRRAARGR